MSSKITQETMDALAGQGAAPAEKQPIDVGVAAKMLREARAAKKLPPDKMMEILISALENIDARLDALEAGKAGS